MTDIDKVILTLAIVDKQLEDEELDEQTRRLLRELKDLDEVDEAQLVSIEQAPKRSKAFAGFLLGVLKATFSATYLKNVFSFCWDRLGNKPIELEVEVKGKKLKVKASSQQELLAATQAAEEFVTAVGK